MSASQWAADLLRIEHGTKVESRAADDLEHVGGGGLLLEDLRSSLSSRVFSMAKALPAEVLWANSAYDVALLRTRLRLSLRVVRLTAER